MAILIVLLLILTILGVNLLLFYFLYQKFGKKIQKMFEMINNMSKIDENSKKLKNRASNK